MIGIIFDLDQTLVDSDVVRPFRDARNWPEVYKRVPQVKAYDGICKLLKELEEAQIPICLVTSAPSKYCGQVVDHCGLRIRHKVCYHDTREHKPHPAPILKGIEALGIPAAQVIAVGDDVKDVLAAKAAGSFAVAVSWGIGEKTDLEASMPDAICDTVAELRTRLFRHIKRG